MYQNFDSYKFELFDVRTPKFELHIKLSATTSNHLKIPQYETVCGICWANFLHMKNCGRACWTFHKHMCVERFQSVGIFYVKKAKIFPVVFVSEAIILGTNQTLFALTTNFFHFSQTLFSHSLARLEFLTRKAETVFTHALQLSYSHSLGTWCILTHSAQLIHICTPTTVEDAGNTSCFTGHHHGGGCEGWRCHDKPRIRGLCKSNSHNLVLLWKYCRTPHLTCA